MNLTETSQGSKGFDVTQILLLAAIYLVAINLATWGVFRHDQNLAVRGSRRIPELGAAGAGRFGRNTSGKTGATVCSSSETKATHPEVHQTD